MTDEQIVTIRKSQQGRYGSSVTAPYADSIQFARAIESAACAERDKRIAELERQLEEARKDTGRWQKLADKLNSAHESTVYLYSLPKGQS